MKILLSLLQVLLGLWHIIGGAYMTTHYQELITESASTTLPSYFWIILGVVQILLSLGLIAALAKKCKKWAPVSAIGLAIIDLAGIFFYITYTGSGLLWAIIPAVLLAFIAYWRGSKR
ncbi:MAG: DoxX family protein [Patescibacteria group bacterium]